MPGSATKQLSDMEIFDDDFLDNGTLSDLNCDCGKTNCVVKRFGRSNKAPIPAGHKGPFPKTDYMSTFEAVKNPRPRSSKKPPQTARDPRPLPMFLTTNQKDDFKDLGHVPRVQPIKQEEHYEPSCAPMEGTTFYSQEFTPKKNSAAQMVPRQMSRRELIAREPANFDDTTTNKQHFKRWVPQPALTFGELPSFTGSIMFPQKENLPQSTMRNSYMGEWQAPVGLIKNAEATIKLEGSHSFNTTHDTTYQDIKGDHRVRPLVQPDTTPLRKRGNFQGKTQTMLDFPGYSRGQPKPPKAAEPAPVTIDLKFDNKRSFSTENRNVYRGHNVVHNPAPPSCKAAVEDYTIPEVKFETETSQKRDFKAHDISGADYSKVKIPQASMGVPVDATFEGKTMNSEMFQNWGIQPRIRYGDFHENRPYIPPKDPFSGESVTQTSFGAKTLDEPTKFYKPDNRPISKAGEQNFNTVYNSEFQKKQQRMCRAQAFLIQQELRRRKKVGNGPSSKCSSAPHAHKGVSGSPAVAQTRA